MSGHIRPKNIFTGLFTLAAVISSEGPVLAAPAQASMAVPESGSLLLLRSGLLGLVGFVRKLRG